MRKFLYRHEPASGDTVKVVEQPAQSFDYPPRTWPSASFLRGRNRLYQIAPQFLIDKTKRVFGYCLPRMNAGAEPK